MYVFLRLGAVRILRCGSSPVQAYIKKGSRCAEGSQALLGLSNVNRTRESLVQVLKMKTIHLPIRFRTEKGWRLSPRERVARKSRHERHYMRVLLRNAKTGLFYKVPWKWTAKRDVACNFGGTFQALRFAENNRLRGMEVVLTFGEPEYDLAISRLPNLYNVR